MRTRSGFAKIWVIQSLPDDGDPKTGEELYKKVLLPLQEKDPRLKLALRQVSNRDELFRVLEEAERDLSTTGDVPVLHFESHGEVDALGLASGEKVLYNQLLPSFRRINLLAQGNLLISAAACYGGWMLTMLIGALDEPAPFWGLFGPTTYAIPSELYSNFEAVYNEICSSGDINEALRRAREVVQRDIPSFTFFSSEYLFLIVWKFMEMASTDDDLRAEIMSGLGARGRAMNELLTNAELRRREYARSARRFFMLDQPFASEGFPNPSYEQMLQVELPPAT